MLSLINAECLITMKQMQTASIDLTITSPPYDDLRKYEGYSFDFQAIAKELFRLTKEGGIVVWIVKDATIDGNETGTSFKQALFFKEIGFKLHDTMIYNKKNLTFPHPNRYHDTFEYMFIFSKGKPKTTNLISDRENKYGGTTTWGDKTQREKDGSLTNKGKREIAETGVRFNVWTYATGKGHTTKDNYAFEHPAMFPEQLAADHILSWSNEGDIIFDPFMGSNTTGKMALLNKRSFIGIEISEKYYAIAKKRVEEIVKQTTLETAVKPIPPTDKSVGILGVILLKQALEGVI